MTNADRILEALRTQGDLDDDELSIRGGVRPRQQVNQLCRRLEAQGRIARVVGSNGKLVNRLLDAGPGSARSIRQLREPATRYEVGPAFDSAAELQQTLFLLPCSARKATGGQSAMEGASLHESLPSNLRARLLSARRRVAEASQLDSDLLLPAYRRYTGYLYGAAAAALRRAVQAGLHVLIISGGYGVVHAAEPVGWYERVFSKRDWPDGILADAIAQYAQIHQLHHARAFLASSSSYYKLLNDLDWQSAGIVDAQLITPIVVGGGSMVKTPRALGEGFSAYVDKTLTSNWRSSDGASLRTISLSP
ncbi:MAG: hypothetical protein E5X65_20715 [Mesorhizobium sp.]|nr:MAG: hypothetical protein E5X65_20715 [Mesorhizobium sp.]